MRGDQAALEQPVRHPEHDLAVLEVAGLRFVGVDDQVDRLASVLREEARLPAHREPGPAPTAQAGREQLVDDRLRLELAGLREHPAAACLAELRQLREIVLICPGEHELHALAATTAQLLETAGTSSGVVGSR